MISVRYYAEFESDLEQAWLWLATDSPAVADRFVDALEQTVIEIARQPGIGWERPWKDRKLRGLRSWRVERFPRFLIFYRLEDDVVAIVAVLHGARSFGRILRRRHG